MSKPQQYSKPFKNVVKNYVFFICLASLTSITVDL